MRFGFSRIFLWLLTNTLVTWRLCWPLVPRGSFLGVLLDLTRCRISFQLISEYVLIRYKDYIQYFLVTFTMLPTFLTWIQVSGRSSNPLRACSGLRALACALRYARVEQGAGEARVLLRVSGRIASWNNNILGTLSTIPYDCGNCNHKFSSMD